MSRRAVCLAGLLSLAARLLLAQIPPEERIPVTDPDRLEAMGLPRDARNVFVWSRGRIGAKESANAETAETWGTGVGYTTVQGTELQEFYDEDVYLIRSFLDAYCSDGNGVSPVGAFAQIQVPEGAVLGLFRSWAYDSDPDMDLRFRVWETCQPFGNDPPTYTLIAENQTLGAIGQISGAKSLNNLTVNNQVCAYTVEVEFAPQSEDCRGSALRVQKLQVSWTRQVSPAPAVASFDDVPTNHPFFQFIEALSESGTTAGCQTDPPLYCPERPITRGEMAVYLAKALGLQWP